MRSVSFRNIFALLAGLALFSASGCAAPQATHHSRQIGRFYGEGISFSVPLLSLAEKPGGEDRYWDLRQGIDQAVVVAFKPLAPESGGFRENMVLTVQDLERDLSPGEFRQGQLAELRSTGALVGTPEEGEDAAGPWLGFSHRQEGRNVVCRAWFFTRPATPEGPARGFVMLGSAPEGPNLAAEIAEFSRIASTVRFGRPPTGFLLMGQAVDQVLAGLAAQSEPAAEAPPPNATSGADSGGTSIRRQNSLRRARILCALGSGLWTVASIRSPNG
ncbi:MAG: hypothetical protein ACOX9B_14030 [Candidatus Xenobium sp.]